MGYPTRVYYTEKDKALMWDRWQKGESLNAIARHFGRSHSGPNCLGGFFRPEVACKDRESQNKDKLRDDPSSTAHDRPEVCGIPILQADASCWEVSLDPVAVERFPYREPIDGRRIEF